MSFTSDSTRAASTPGPVSGIAPTEGPADGTSLGDVARHGAAFRVRALAALHRTPSGAVRDGATVRGDIPAAPPSDFDLNPGLFAELAVAHPDAPPPVPASVLVAIVDRDPLTVLLTQRTDRLQSHAGQIAFPGGKIDPGDRDPLAAALREADEEIGLDPTLVEPLGYLDRYRTSTGYIVHPVVALVVPTFTLRPNPREVADVFEVPLAFLMDPRNHHRRSRLWQGRERHFYAMPFGERFIWGATAGMIRNMHQRLFVG